MAVMLCLSLSEYIFCLILFIFCLSGGMDICGDV